MNKKIDRTSVKIGSNGEEITIPNPDYYDEDGKFRKIRKGGNNRKKNKRRK